LVVVGGLAPPIQGRGYRAAYEQLCEKHGCLLVDDILGGIMGRHELMADQIHPNGKGYAILAERFAEAVRPHL
jgi:lysophospholipase L1-like esterase